MLNLDEILRNVYSVGIAGHVRPDGDCIGSCLGLYLFIRKYYQCVRADVFLEKIPEKYRFLKGADLIRSEVPEDAKYDVFFCLDCGDLKRLGDRAVLEEKAKKSICIDHHITNDSFADFNYVKPDASSTSELVTDLIGMDRIDHSMAEALYLGMVHDTGSFQYSCTSSHTMKLAGALMDKGIDYSRIVADTFFLKTYVQQMMTSVAFLKSERRFDGRVMLSLIDRDEMEKYGALTSDLDGISAQMRQTEGVDAAAFFYEDGDGTYRVSLRGDDGIDVAAIASVFGGGGHRKAAGCSMKGTQEEMYQALTDEFAKQISAESSQ